MSSVQTGKLKLDRKPLRLAESLKAVLGAVSVQARAAQVSIDASTLNDQETLALVVHGDTTRIEQIVWNLLSNAIKFTPAGGSVNVSLCQEGTEVRLDVSDTGIGIPAESLERVFTMFSPVEREHDRQNRHGLDIGLALVAQLTQAHGGRVTATSPGEGKGSVFSLWFPLADQTADQEESQVAQPAGALQALRLLLVDDSEEILSMLGSLCEMEGAEVVMVSNGQEALEQLEAAEFDILISDLGMPVMDGYSLLSRLRAGTRNADIPAIALTGYGHSEKARAVGFTDQLCKPVPMKELLSKVAELTTLPRRG